MSRINRWFGGVATTRRMIERVASATGKKHFSMLEVAAGFGEVPKIAAQQLARKGITLDITYLDRAQSHLAARGPCGSRGCARASLPRRQLSIWSAAACSRITWSRTNWRASGAEALRVSRCAVLINDLIRSPIHLALVYAGFPLMRSYVSRFDGPASVRRAYVPEEMREILSSGVQPEPIETCTYLFRMGVMCGSGKTRQPSHQTVAVFTGGIVATLVAAASK